MQLSEINPAAYNPRVDLKPGDKEYELIKKGIAEFGLVEPLVWNRTTGNLVGGHQRLKVLKELGYTEAEVSVVELPEGKEKQLNIALNKLAGSWDMPLLKDLLEELDCGADDIEFTGFTEEELEGLMSQYHVADVAEDDFDADAEAEKIAEPTTKRGDIWLLGNHRLMCGDSTCVTDVERLMDGERFDLCVTSPPYSDQREYEIGSFDWLELMNGVWLNIIGFATEQAHILINLGPSHKDRKVNRYWDPWLDYAEETGWPLFGWYVWDKGYGLCGNWNGRLAPSHEFLFHFNIECDAANKWLKTKTEKKAKKRTFTFRLRDGTVKRASSPDKCGQSTKIPDSVIRILREVHNTTNHPAVYCVELPAFIMQTWTHENDLCFEPFSGSGTTIIAAEQLNRVCYAMEISERYCDVAVARWEKLTGRQAKLELAI